MNSPELRSRIRQLERQIEAEGDTIKQLQLIQERLQCIEQLCEHVEGNSGGASAV